MPEEQPMYAVIKTGGKQYRVQPGETIHVEKLEADEGKTVAFTEVLMVAEGENVRIGRPLLAGVSVTAEVLKQERDRKILVYKYRRRKGWHRKQGHRQPLTAVKVTEITG
jgi:large subunit ribosomal protein L21